jgi:hypothetical protein
MEVIWMNQLSSRQTQLLERLGHEVRIGDAAQIRASYVRKQKDGSSAWVAALRHHALSLAAAAIHQSPNSLRQKGQKPTVLPMCRFSCIVWQRYHRSPLGV